MRFTIGGEPFQHGRDGGRGKVVGHDGLHGDAAMSNALTMEKSLPSRYQIVNLIVFIYQLDVRYRRHEILQRLQHAFGPNLIARISFRVG